METTEIPHHHGGIYNYFQGATIHNMIINGNMTKNASDIFHGNGKEKTVTPEQVAYALRECSEHFPSHASLSIAFCVWRDLYHGGDNTLEFERMLRDRGIDLPKGTVNNAMSRKPYQRCNVEKWEEMNVPAKDLKARDMLVEKIENLLINAQKTA